MEVDDVLRMIDYKTEELDDIFKEFNVLHTEGVDPSFVKGMADMTRLSAIVEILKILIQNPMNCILLYFIAFLKTFLLNFDHFHNFFHIFD